MDGLIIKIDWVYFLGIIGSLIAIAWYSSGRFSRSEVLLETLDKRLTNIEGRFSGTFQSQSPISLTVKGKSLLDGSGLNSYIDKKKDNFYEKCKLKKNLKTAYDVQETAFDCLDNIVFDPEFELKLKEFAFQNGVDVGLLRRIGGIYLRNLLLEELGMKEKDLEVPLINEESNDITT